MEKDGELRQTFRQLWPHLNERARRMVAASRCRITKRRFV
jgi:hypothetical protein